jgi:hypothetical protein
MILIFFHSSFPDGRVSLQLEFGGHPTEQNIFAQSVGRHFKIFILKKVGAEEFLRSSAPSCSMRAPRCRFQA